MSTTPNAVLVDPDNRVLRAVNWDWSIPDLRRILQCDHVEVHTLLTLGEPATLWCNEEASTHRPAKGPLTMVRFSGVEPLFLGRLLLTGCAYPNGDPAPFTMPPDELADLLQFVVVQ